MSRPSDVRVSGPLAAYAPGFRAELAATHYTPLSAANQTRLMAHLSRWLGSRRIEPRQLSEAVIQRYVRARRRAGYTCWRSRRGLAPLVAYLRAAGAVPEAVAPEPKTPDRLVAEYVDHLRSERGLAEATVRAREIVAREFVTTCAFVAKDVRRFMLARIGRGSAGAAGLLATAVRSLLRFVHVRGYIEWPLTGAVPKIAGWRLARLPQGLEPAQVDALLASCDRRRAVGRRDYAILHLVVRLGMRASEVARLRLCDIDWRAGELVVRGKGRRHDRLPLPADVGEALAGYLQRGRPECEACTVFVSDRAPHRPLGRSAVTSRVGWASRRAGGGRIGAHRLRHTVATQMLRRGGSLAEIGQVLRHSHAATTAIYAKVDRDALRTLARPWPRGDA